MNHKQIELVERLEMMTENASPKESRERAIKLYKDQMDRLKEAIEGELDGLAIDDDQANRILKWVLFEAE